MRISDKLREKYMGKFAVRHAGILVIPQQEIHGKSMREPFDTEAQAEAWARRNYRGADWEVVQFCPRPLQ